MTAPTEPATGPGCRCVTLRQITDRPRVVVEHVGHRLIEHQQPIDRDQPVRRQFDPRQRTGSWDPVFPNRRLNSACVPVGVAAGNAL